MGWHPRVAGVSRPARCSGTPEGNDGNLSDQQLRQLAAEVQQSPEFQEKLRRVDAAAAQVAALQAAQADIEQQLAAAANMTEEENRRLERQQAQAASERGATADMLAAADQLEEAQREMQVAQAEQLKWSLAASKDLERVESSKAATVAGAGGLLASLPYLLSTSQLGLVTAASAAICLASCALFGVTYRYAIRRDIGDSHLKGGVIAAFGLVRGLAQAETIQETAAKAGNSILSADVLGQAALVAGESMLTFGFAAVAMEIALRQGYLRPFGVSTPQQ
ncbi:hypothetical protein WJX72_000632 [[Myrmecia] bisecta]|uniref:Uncharacterized protein n=1 Tax=[Myrmecia] bisecta TaxID=41462 RepID=A0AAW1QE19_9CHLO